MAGQVQAVRCGLPPTPTGAVPQTPFFSWGLGSTAPGWRARWSGPEPKPSFDRLRDSAGGCRKPGFLYPGLVLWIILGDFLLRLRDGEVQ